MSVEAILRAIGPLAGRGRGIVLAIGVLAASLTAAALPSATFAAAPEELAGSQMLVESDQLVYDYDNNTASAVGNAVRRAS